MPNTFDVVFYRFAGNIWWYVFPEVFFPSVISKFYSFFRTVWPQIVVHTWVNRFSIFIQTLYKKMQKVNLAVLLHYEYFPHFATDQNQYCYNMII